MISYEAFCHRQQSHSSKRLFRWAVLGILHCHLTIGKFDLDLGFVLGLAAGMDAKVGKTHMKKSRPALVTESIYYTFSYGMAKVHNLPLEGSHSTVLNEGG